MKKIAVTSTATISAIAAGLLLLGFSPSGCSCISAIHSLAYHAGYEVITPETDLSPTGIATGLNRTLQGQKLVFGNYPYLEQDGCSERSAGQIVCKVPVTESPFLKRGYKVTYHGVDGKFVRATVSHAIWL